MPNNDSEELASARNNFMAAQAIKILAVDQKIGRRILTSREGTVMTSEFQTMLAQSLAITFYSWIKALVAIRVHIILHIPSKVLCSALHSNADNHWTQIQHECQERFRSDVIITCKDASHLSTSAWYQPFRILQLFLNHHHHLPPSFHPLHRLPLLTPFNRPLPQWSCLGSCCHSGESCDVSSTGYCWSQGSDLWVAVCAYTHVTTADLSYSFQPFSQCTAVSSWLLVLSTDTGF